MITLKQFVEFVASLSGHQVPPQTDGLYWLKATEFFAPSRLRGKDCARSTAKTRRHEESRSVFHQVVRSGDDRASATRPRAGCASVTVPAGDDATHPEF